MRSVNHNAPSLAAEQFPTQADGQPARIGFRRSPGRCYYCDMWSRNRGIALVLVLGGALTACCALAAERHPGPPPGDPSAGSDFRRPAVEPRPSEGDKSASLELIESWPVETTLDHPDIRDAADVWPVLIDGARTSLDIAEFYLSDDSAGGGRLIPVIRAIERAARRGVRVRILVEEAFYQTYPELPDRFARVKGIRLRRLDSKAFSRGILHAKYFIVDRTTVYLGSQNFDWRSLDHIQELGLIIRGERPNLLFREIFELDWDLAGSFPPGSVAPGAGRARADSILARHWVLDAEREYPIAAAGGGAPGTMTPVASPVSRIPNRETWDEPRLIALIDAARTTLNLQLLTMTPFGRDSTYYPDLELALKRAASRGVRVRVLVSEWCKSAPTVRHLKALALFPGIEIRFMVIPQWSGGFVPFSRTVHAKYLGVDADRFWLGTSNWERNYFHESRNVGVIARDPVLARQLQEFFDGNWNSGYVEAVDPRVEYLPPRVAR